MNRRLHYTVFGCIVIMAANCQVSPVAKEYMAVSAYSKDQPGLFAFLVNDAALAVEQKAAAGFYSERRFLVEGLNHFLAVAVVPVDPGSFGLKISSTGFSEYKETIFGLSYGRKLTEDINIGALFCYQGQQFTTYGRTKDMFYGIAAIIHPVERLTTGIRFMKTANNSAMSYSFGIGYDVSEIFILSSEIIKEAGQPTGMNVGCSYQIAQRMALKAGITNTSLIWVAAGLQLKSFQLNLFSGYHTQLGITPGFGLQFYFKKEEG